MPSFVVCYRDRVPGRRDGWKAWSARQAGRNRWQEYDAAMADLAGVGNIEIGILKRGRIRVIQRRGFN